MLTATRPAPSPTPPAPAPSRRTWSAAGPGDGAAAVALAVVTLASAGGLMRVFTGSAWLGPIMLTAAGTHLALWVMRRRRFPQPVAALLGLAVISLMVIWTVYGSTTRYGIPAGHTWSSISTALRHLQSQVSSGVAPLRPTQALETVAAATAGVVALAADWFAFRWDMPLLAVLPGLGAFVAAAVSGRGSGRAVVVGLEAAAVCIYFVVERAARLNGQVWFAGVRSGSAGWSWRVGGAIAAGGVATALIVTPFLTPIDGTGALGWRSGIGLGGGQRVVANPIVTLRTRLVRLADTQVFVVQSDVSSYWRLTSLDFFSGDTWTSSGSYQSFASKLPGTAAVPPGTRTAHATFKIQNLDSVWLPDQFNPVSVEGARHVSYDPNSNSLITSRPTSNGMNYSVTSYQYLSTLSADQLRTAPPAPSLPADLELPPNIGVQVVDLARQITRHQSTEYDKALALENYLRSPPFRYTLNPPADGTGVATLYNFLFVTHQGYCQQFAGTYAVLARAAGLPTRLAFGFTTGDSYPGGFQVHDRDAHTWPEVWFGPRYGWVPFEPTPGFAIPGTGGYASTSGTATGPATAPTTTVPTSSPTPSTPKGSAGSAKTTTTTVASSLSHHAATGSASLWWLAVPAVIALLAGWFPLSEAGRRAYRKRRLNQAARRGPEEAVLEVWGQLRSDLAWEGLRAAPAETDDEFARRATTWLERRMVRGPWQYGGINRLAALARQAAFAVAIPREATDQAQKASAEIRTRLQAVQARSNRVRRALFLPPRRD
jgi:transglutaminase-like putative cysteine protease